MKIGVDIRALMDERYSGVSAYAEQLLKELLRQDQENEYHLFYNSFHDLSARFSAWENERVKVIGTHFPNKIFNYGLQKIFGRPYLDKLLGGVDLFWSPHFNFSNFSQGSKNILTVHDLSFLRAPEFFSWRKNCWHKLLGIKKLISRADLIVAISENTKLDLMDIFQVPAEKIKVIYSGLNLPEADFAETAQQDFFNKYGIKNDFILSVGNIEPRKNLDGLIKAYEVLRTDNPELKNQLVLAGAPGWQNKHIYSAAKKSKFASDIIFTGYVSESEKKILYQQASVFVFPSFYEGFGFPPLEAMSYGLPVIASNSSSIPEVVGNSALLINPIFPSEIAAALEIILSDKETREKYRAAGQKRLSLFSWQKTASEYLQLFKNV
ncbi:MAG: glycosyltransferase family 1 protein [Patescibacteria group bacterium]|nr:glycosyltransferase family 1 protein [Patescibacteria group bacterium]